MNDVAFTDSVTWGVDLGANHLEDPREKWGSMQEEMLRDYLRTAQTDLEVRQLSMDCSLDEQCFREELFDAVYQFNVTDDLTVDMEYSYRATLFISRRSLYSLVCWRQLTLPGRPD